MRRGSLDWYFNPRSREGSDLASIPLISCFMSYFNPRSREGSDVAALAAGFMYLWISIHAPARGATSPSYAYSSQKP